MIESPIEQALELHSTNDENPQNVKNYLFGIIASSKAAFVSHNMKLSKRDGIMLLAIFRRMLLDEGYSTLSPSQQRDDRLKCQRIIDWGGAAVRENQNLINEFCMQMTSSESKKSYSEDIESPRMSYFRDGGLEGSLTRALEGGHTPKNSAGSKSCFVATACFGSCDADTVMVFRRYREAILRKTQVGRLAIYWYYRLSPPLAQFVFNHSRSKRITSWAFGKIAAHLKRKYRWLS